MTSQSTERSASAPYGVAAAPLVKLLTAKEAAQILRVSESFLAKARMRGDGPPFIKMIGRSIRYREAALLQWVKAHQRLSTSEH
jgi:predicted DNA-binding transcriptional regulator AlpA